MPLRFHVFLMGRPGGTAHDVARQEFTDARQLRDRMEEAGFTFTGLTDRRSPYVELRGKPQFKELHGPMYGGPGIIRYEEWATNRIMTMD